MRILTALLKPNAPQISTETAQVSVLGLTVLFGLAFSWISACTGIWVKEVESAQVAGFIWVFPLVFISSFFVPVNTMPGWLQAAAKVNPITVTVDPMRALSLGGTAATPYGNLWSG